MEKISGIIPKSARLSSGDLRDSGPVRSGAPGFGRDSAQVSQRLKPGTSTAERGVEAMRQQMDWRGKDQVKAQFAKEVADSFFGKPQQLLNERIEMEPVMSLPEERSGIIQVQQSRVSKPAGFNTDDLKSQREFNSAPIDEDPVQPDGLFPKGSFIDRAA